MFVSPCGLQKKFGGCVVDLTESFRFGLESESVAGFDVKSESLNRFGFDRIQKTNTRTPNLLKKDRARTSLETKLEKMMS